MKRSALIKHIEKHGCQLLREGANHAIYNKSEEPEANSGRPSSGTRQLTLQENLQTT